MKDKKLQVFVSSTYTDLKEERQAAVEAILSSGNIPAGMELFSAGDESQMTVIERWIDESDVYLLILGGRYGSIESKSGKSYTHLEYEYALEKKKPLFAVVISDKARSEKLKQGDIDVVEQENPHLLKKFRAQVTSNLVKFWDDKKDIKLAIFETLGEFSHKKELVGWIKGDNAVNGGALAEEIARLTKENAELRDRLSNSNNNTTEPLYSGLQYETLKALLLKDEVQKHGPINLYEFLVSQGERIANSMRLYDSKEKKYIDKLITYKLVLRNSTAGGTYYLFTDDGHKFYLRSIVEGSNLALTPVT